MYFFPFCSICQEPSQLAEADCKVNLIRPKTVNLFFHQGHPARKNRTCPRNVDLCAASYPKAVYSSDSGSPGLRKLTAPQYWHANLLLECHDPQLRLEHRTARPERPRSLPLQLLGLDAALNLPLNCVFNSKPLGLFF